MAETNWTESEITMFELSLDLYPESLSNRWETMATHMNKPVQELKNRYARMGRGALLDDISIQSRTEPPEAKRIFSPVDSISPPETDDISIPSRTEPPEDSVLKKHCDCLMFQEVSEANPILAIEYNIAPLEANPILMIGYVDNIAPPEAVPNPTIVNNSINPQNIQNNRQRRNYWSEEEHRLFLEGLKKYGRGDWKAISRNCVRTRTPAQIASHAQKFFERQKLDIKERTRKKSILDITLPGTSTHDPSGQQQHVDTTIPGSSTDDTSVQQHVVDLNASPEDDGTANLD